MWELRREIENRKENLIFTLKNKKEAMELEKQHQIYGAIKELNHVLGLIEQLREEEMMIQPKQIDINTSYVQTAGGDEEEEEFKATENSSDSPKPSVIKLVGEKVRKVKMPIRIRFAKRDA